MLHHGRRAPGRRRRRRHFSLLLFGAVVLSLCLALQPQAGGQNGPAPTQPPVQQAKALDSPLDAPLALVYEAKRKFAEVRDYTCTMQSQERVGGNLLEANLIMMKARTQPFSVYMRWILPESSRNQEVCFVLGRNKNKMRVKSHRLGKGGLIGWVSVDPTDPRVMEHSRHTIYEAGLGNLIEQTIKHWQMEKQLGKTDVTMAEYTYDKRRVIRVETRRKERLPQFYCYRSVLYVDKETKLPVRTENYDWPRAGGPADGDLLEMFSYFDMRVNVGLSDREFNK